MPCHNCNYKAHNESFFTFHHVLHIMVIKLETITEAGHVAVMR